MLYRRDPSTTISGAKRLIESQANWLTGIKRLPLWDRPFVPDRRPAGSMAFAARMQRSHHFGSNLSFLLVYDMIVLLGSIDS